VTQAAPSGPTMKPCGAALGPSAIRSDWPVLGSSRPSSPGRLGGKPHRCRPAPERMTSTRPVFCCVVAAGAQCRRDPLRCPLRRAATLFSGQAPPVTVEPWNALGIGLGKPQRWVARAS
jgi:hypothetical protein